MIFTKHSYFGNIIPHKMAKSILWHLITILRYMRTLNDISIKQHSSSKLSRQMVTTRAVYLPSIVLVVIVRVTICSGMILWSAVMLLFLLYFGLLTARGRQLPRRLQHNVSFLHITPLLHNNHTSLARSINITGK